MLFLLTGFYQLNIRHGSLMPAMLRETAPRRQSAWIDIHENDVEHDDAFLACIHPLHIATSDVHTDFTSEPSWQAE